MGVLGIDPGRSSGSIAYVWRQDGKLHGEAFYLCDMTEYEIWDTLKRYSSKAKFAVLERVHAMPKQGVSSSFKFGTSYGELRMAIVAAGIRVEHITPQKWQKAMKCLSGGDKKVTRTRAQEVFPNIKITHKNADALLIAEFGRRFLSKIVK